MIVPFEPWHISLLNIREEQEYILSYYKDLLGDLHTYGEYLLESAGVDQKGDRVAWTAMKNGFPILCAGIYSLMPHVGQAWALVTKDFTNAEFCDKIDVVREIRKGITTSPYSRVQADTEVWFDVAQKFLESLGFKKEGIMKGYSPDGGDSILYGRVA